MAFLKVRVTPGAREDAISGWQADPSTASGQALRVRVRARPERGKANEAVCRLLARALALPAGSVSVKQGATSRDKLLEIDGLTDEQARLRLNAPML